jgi:hypothetical protein
MQTAPDLVSVSGREVGVGSRRDYAAAPRPGTPEAAQGELFANTAESDPAIDAALSAKFGAPAPACSLSIARTVTRAF